MTSDRIKEIQETTAYPESVSVMLALKQVWNECEQENKYSEEDMRKAFYANEDTDIGAEYLTFTEWFEQFKKK